MILKVKILVAQNAKLVKDMFWMLIIIFTFFVREKLTKFHIINILYQFIGVKYNEKI